MSQNFAAQTFYSGFFFDAGNQFFSSSTFNTIMYGETLDSEYFLSSVEPELFSLSNWGLEYFHPPIQSQMVVPLLLEKLSENVSFDSTK